ncbi:Striatin-3 [Cichlidogyrus casuarinus]|uniref:Striatin-3 n=1 Tax=Cichlidogyrus casuarinus TaxID=1844966 RepID=A0ABD2PXN0_9PLAT
MLEFAVRQERAKASSSRAEQPESSLSNSIERQLVQNEEKRYLLSCLQRLNLNDSVKIKLKELITNDSQSSVNTVYRQNRNLYSSPQSANSKPPNVVLPCEQSSSKVNHEDTALDDIEDMDAFDALAELDSNIAQHVDSSASWKAKPSDDLPGDRKINSLMHSPRMAPDQMDLGNLAALVCENESSPVCNVRNALSNKAVLEAAVRAKVMDSIDGVILGSSPDTNLFNGTLEVSPLNSSNSSLNSIVSVIAAQQQDAAHALNWELRYTLRGHFDSIRQIVFHPSDTHVVTASEDCTLKIWNLAKSIQNKKSPCRDVEPVYTLHGHTAPVLTLDIWSPGTSIARLHKHGDHADAGAFGQPHCVIVSGSLDGSIKSWCLPQLNSLDPYEPFNPRYIGPRFKGHSSAVWAIRTLPKREQSFLSMSCDGDVRLWSLTSLLDHDLAAVNAYPFGSKGLRSSLPRYPEPITKSLHDYPISSWISSAPTALQLVAPTGTDRSFVCGFQSGDLCLVSLETGQLVSSSQPKTSGSKSRINASILKYNQAERSCLLKQDYFSIDIQ